MTRCLPISQRSPGLEKTGSPQLGIHIEVVFPDFFVKDVGEQVLNLGTVKARQVGIEMRIIQILQESGKRLLIPSASELLSIIFRLFPVFIYIDNSAGNLSVSQVNCDRQCWCPPMIVISLFTTRDVAKPNSSIDIFSFLYSLSPGFSFTLGLYSAGLSTEIGSTLFSSFQHQLPP